MQNQDALFRDVCLDENQSKMHPILLMIAELSCQIFALDIETAMPEQKQSQHHRHPQTTTNSDAERLQDYSTITQPESYEHQAKKLISA